MNQQQKTEIAKLAQDKLTQPGMTLKLASSASGLSETNLSFLKNDKWQEKSIDVKQWLKLARWVGYALEGEAWVTVEDAPNFRRIFNICDFARANKTAMCISGHPGAGKSHTLMIYADRNAINTFYIQCKKFWTRREFLVRLTRVLGVSDIGQNTSEMVEAIVDRLNSIPGALLIIDEADKLIDPAFDLFKDFYDETLGQCAFVLCGAPYLKKRLLKGVRLCKQSYQETYSRLGGEFTETYDIDADTVVRICQVNGLTERQHIKEVINTAHNDLRRVYRTIKRIKLRQEVGA